MVGWRIKVRGGEEEEIKRARLSFCKSRMSSWVLSDEKRALLGEWTGGGVDETCRRSTQ